MDSVNTAQLDALHERLLRLYLTHSEKLPPEDQAELESICDEVGAHVAELEGDRRSAERLRAKARSAAKPRPVPISPNTPPRRAFW